MATTVVEGPAIYAGYTWTLRINSTGLFPSSAVIVSHVRKNITDENILATLSTTNGRIVRVDDDNIDITIPGEISKNWNTGKIAIDFVRTDLDPDVHLGFKIFPTVTRPVTRGI